MYVTVCQCGCMRCEHVFVDVHVSVSECEYACMHTKRYSRGICTDNSCISFGIQCLTRIAPEACVQRQGGGPAPVGSGWWRGLLRSSLGGSQLNQG